MAPALYNGRTASVKLNIIIVGGGIGGFAAAGALAQAGHNITVLESVAVKVEVGAGIQCGPNMARILRRWGLGSRLEEIAHADKLESLSIFRYADGDILGCFPRGDQDERRYGASTYQLHRADLHNILYEHANAKPHFTLRTGSKVISVSASSDPSASAGPTVTLESGEILTADVVIGADGIRSVVCGMVNSEGQNKATPTGVSAYRFMVSSEPMLADPDLRGFVEKSQVLLWPGPAKLLVAYGVRGQKEFNVVALVEDRDADAGYSWTAKGDTKEMQKLFAGFEPRVGKILSLTKSPHTLKYKLMNTPPLDTWVHPGGRVTLLGDACHAMLPSRAQGAAMAIEDAEVLGSLFSRISSIREIAPLLHAYESICRERATKTQQMSTSAREDFHLVDGPRQEKRDAILRAGMRMMREKLKEEDLDEDARAALHGMKMRQQQDDEQFGYDVGDAAEMWWKENGGAALRSA